MPVIEVFQCNSCSYKLGPPLNELLVALGYWARGHVCKWSVHAWAYRDRKLIRKIIFLEPVDCFIHVFLMRIPVQTDEQSQQAVGITLVRIVQK